ncbi:hypothetical protein [Bacillus halotolerans]|uniref:hypothetical protein n=1 Tax=Bacillus halotolerans TaxID=260554 RepID=UPI002DB814D8|nr:hypothetical protein [Bacillus halotolerans]MEC1648229.1 hypothetical protein [Bacillus halotolerans]
MGTKKYVRIKKATVDGVWYADRIGQIFEVERLNSVSVLTNRGVHGESSVLVEDVEFIFTEKRKAAVGECVLITDMEDSELRWARYRNYDVGVVREEAEYGGHAYCNINGYSGVLVLRGEYEVIVNSEVKNEEANEMKIDLNAMGYVELMAHGDAVMEAIKKRTFQEGFRAAKQVQRKLAKMNAEKSAQDRRDEIVEQAKADVEKLVLNGYDGEGFWGAEGNETYRKFSYSVEFLPDRKKWKVTALIRRTSDIDPRHVGRAKAAPDDCFNVHIGKAIALRRALGLAVPDEYLNAPQPTEVRVGDVIKYGESGGVATVVSMESDANIPTETYLTTAEAYPNRIIDDSREEVGGE